MKHRPADFRSEPPGQAFSRILHIAFMIRIGSWLLTPDGLFRWTRYDFDAGGKPAYRYDWRKLRLPFR